MFWALEGGLGSGRQLAAFHWARARLYASLHKMLAGPLTQVELTNAKPPLGAVGTLGGGDEWIKLRAAVAMLSPAEVEKARQALGQVEPACSGSEVSDDLCLAAGAQEATGPRDEIEAMARLAEATGWALSQGDLSRAADLTSLQVRFLREHGGACLQGLARSLKALSSPWLKQVGDALAWLVAHDQNLLEAPVRTFGAGS